MKHVLAWGFVALYCSLIFYLSSLSHPPGEKILVHVGDKTVHAAVFGILAGLVTTASHISIRGWGPRACAAFGFLCATVYGATDEIHQHWTPGRSSDVRDLIADATGAAAGVLLFLWLWRLYVFRTASRVSP